VLTTILGVLVVALAVGGLAFGRRRGDRPTPTSTLSASEPVEGGTVGSVPGYMPGIRQKAELREDASTELVEPPHDRDALVDLDANTIHVQRGR
jgi:hypothetical protein